MTNTLSVIPAGAPDGSPAKRESIVRDEVRLEDQEARARIVDAERREELAQDEARRADEARAVEAVRPPTYEVTLENLSSRGLPPRVVFPAAAGVGHKASEPDDLDAKTLPAGDIVLSEGLSILADDVGLLGGHG